MTCDERRLPPAVDPGFYCELATLVTAAVLKPNVHEPEVLAGYPLRSRDAILAAARSLLKGGTELIVVPMDAGGALFLEQGRIVSATPPRVQVRATVGAGALLAGIVPARLRMLDLPELTRLASRFALEAVTGRAAAEWLGEVVVESLA